MPDKSPEVHGTDPLDTSRPRRPYKARDPTVTSAIMSTVRGRNNKADLALRRELWRRGRRYRLYVNTLPGTPDLVFTRKRLAVFVDGDYWHGRTLIEEGENALALRFHETKRDFWVAKIARNARRDMETTGRLQNAGWRVLRLWESDILRDVSAAADMVEVTLESAEESE